MTEMKLSLDASGLAESVEEAKLALNRAVEACEALNVAYSVFAEPGLNWRIVMTTNDEGNARALLTLAKAKEGES